MMPDEQERARRMVDVGMEEAEISFDLGEPISKEEIEEARERLEKSKWEEDK